MIRSQNLRPFSVDGAVTNPDLVHSVHQLGNEIERETGAAESLNSSFGRDDYLCVLDRVLEIIRFHRSKIECGAGDYNRGRSLRRRVRGDCNTPSWLLGEQATTFYLRTR